MIALLLSIPVSSGASKVIGNNYQIFHVFSLPLGQRQDKMTNITLTPVQLRTAQACLAHGLKVRRIVKHRKKDVVQASLHHGYLQMKQVPYLLHCNFNAAEMDVIILMFTLLVFIL